jgi:hypothetical protein
VKGPAATGVGVGTGDGVGVGTGDGVAVGAGDGVTVGAGVAVGASDPGVAPGALGLGGRVPPLALTPGRYRSSHDQPPAAARRPPARMRPNAAMPRANRVSPPVARG